jgi:hypothetical protein
VFSEPTGGWASEASETQTAELSASNGVTFGWSVAAPADGSSVIAGALGTFVGTTEGAGAAFVFGSSSAGTTTTSTNAAPTPTSSTGATPPTTNTSPATPAVGHVVTDGTSATVPLSCSGPAGSSCEMKLSLSVTETVQGSKVLGITARAAGKPKRRKKVVVLGTITTTVLVGHSRKAKLSLNAQGKRLLASHKTLSVKLVVTRIQGKSTKTVATKTLKFQSKPRAKK